MLGIIPLLYFHCAKDRPIRNNVSPLRKEQPPLPTLAHIIVH